MNDQTRNEMKIPSIFDAFGDIGFAGDWPSIRRISKPNAEAATPLIDIHESDSDYIVSAELPGIKKEDINVTVHDGVLTINAESKNEIKEENNGRVVRQERHFGNLVRSMRLGNDIQQDNVKAEYKDGLLKLTIPKAEAAKPRVIDVKVL